MFPSTNSRRVYWACDIRTRNNYGGRKNGNRPRLASPRTVKETRGFLGLCSYYRKFVTDFAIIADPLHELTHKNVKFQWGVDCQNAFAQLKTALITAPILALPIDDGNYVLDIDPSGLSIGVVLSQEQDGKEKVIAYTSKLLNHAEQSYCVTRRNPLAVITISNISNNIC